MSQWYLGVDPGLSGALAFYKPASGSLLYFRMPTYALSRNGKSKREIDALGLARILDETIDLMGAAPIAVIEKVGAMPGQGVSSVFSFGKSFGHALQACASQFLRIELVPPQVWKKAMGVTSDKDSSRALASKLLPKHSKAWALAKDDGVAEAALMAVYGSRVFT